MTRLPSLPDRQCPFATPRASAALPHRGAAGPGDDSRFLALAGCSRSAQELLTATLRRPVVVRPVGNTVITAEPAAPASGPPAGTHAVRVLTHLLIDSRPPRPAVGLSTAAVLAVRLPASLRADVRRGLDTLDALLDRAGAYWTAETFGMELVSGPMPVVRLRRRLYLLGTPVAVVAEEIAPTGVAPVVAEHGRRGPPWPRTFLEQSWTDQLA
jgi:hypothetical protein